MKMSRVGHKSLYEVGGDADIVGVFEEGNRGLRGLEKFYQGRDCRHG